MAGAWGFDNLGANLKRAPWMTNLNGEIDRPHLSFIDLPNGGDESVYFAMLAQEDEWLLLALERSLDDCNRA
jgi:hypothetical protein